MAKAQPTKAKAKGVVPQVAAEQAMAKATDA